MIIKCPICKLECESEEDIHSGQKVQCPNCEKTFVYEELEKPQYQMPEIITTGIEFEKFLCNHINKQDGMHCEMTKASGDQGVDLVVEVGGKKVAIQCKLYAEPVGNDSVQQVVAGRIVYKCDEAMVVTNSTFTKSAEELAAATNVHLVNYKLIIEVLDGIRSGISAAESETMLYKKAISEGNLADAEKVVLRTFSRSPNLRAAHIAIETLMDFAEQDVDFTFSRETFKLLGQYYYNLTAAVKATKEKDHMPFIAVRGADYIESFTATLMMLWRLSGICFEVAGVKTAAECALDQADAGKVSEDSNVDPRIWEDEPQYFGYARRRHTS